MPEVCLIVNPVSGPKRRGRGPERVTLARQTFDRLGVTGQIRLTERAGHAHDLAREAAASGVDLVIAWGGDGTINEVARALVQSDEAGMRAPALGIVPGGSGNGLARELAIPFGAPSAIEHALRSVPRAIDAGDLGDHLFFNVAGIGIDAHVAALVTTRVRHRGLWPYLAASARDLLRYGPVEYTIDIGGERIRESALVLAFANARQWGFGAEIAPRAELSDGLLDFVIVQDRGFLGNALRVPSLFLRRIDRREGIHTHRVREVTIRAPEPMLFHVDGEAVQGTDTLVARVRPAALRIQAGSA